MAHEGRDPKFPNSQGFLSPELVAGIADQNPLTAHRYSKCTQAHNFDYHDCLNIIRSLDEIDEKIKKVSDEEIKCNTQYDFENAAQHIEWSRHNIHTAQQNAAKNKIISEMKSDEAFCTFNCGQKILLQKCGEKQSTYLGKERISMLIGSFV